MQRTVPLKEVAAIRTGYTFRQAGDTGRDGELLGLQIGDVRDADVIETRSLRPVEWGRKEEPPVLVPGDVVFAAKGSYNRAVLYSDKHARVLPSNQFLILSVKNENLLSPEFLRWVLNYSSVQKRIAEYRTGTNISSVSKRSLGEVLVPLPDRSVQGRILALQAVSDEQKRLLENLQDNTETMLQGVVQELLSGAAS